MQRTERAHVKESKRPRDAFDEFNLGRQRGYKRVVPRDRA